MSYVPGRGYPLAFRLRVDPFRPWNFEDRGKYLSLN
jgi:hypothetical protein